MRRVLLALGVALALAAPARAQKFRPDDPVRVDHDDLPIARPGKIELSTAYDVIEHTFHHRPRGPVPRAANANTLGEVPDSSWFTSRPALTVEELLRGPGGGDGGPDPSGPWTVTRGKSQGITPGFTIRDPRGVTYFLKFDPVAYPRLSTGADVVVSRLFHAFGYNVPDNNLVRFRRDQLLIDPEAKVSVRGGKRRKMTGADLDAMLANVPREADGRFLGVAGRRLEGEDVGPFKYHGTRGDDPNDIFPHEHRRELRGLRVFCAWLNHDDSRSVNTLDTWVPKEGGGYVRHHLIDFSSTMGSGSDAERRIAPQNPRAGNEYVLDWGPLLRSLFSFGFLDRPWRTVEYEVFPEVGRFEASFFRPERWKPEYPNPAFERMQNEDGYWAARIVARISDDMLRAVLRLAGIQDRAAEAHLFDVLRRRRDKTVEHYFRQVAPLDGFVVQEGALRFENLGERMRVAYAQAYEYEWFTFDNASGRRTSLGPAGLASTRALPLPASDAPFLMVRIRTRSPGEARWYRAVDVTLRGPDRAVVGIERE